VPNLRKWLTISLVLSIVSILALILFTISTSTIYSLISINPIFLFSAIFFQLISWLIWGVRLKIMSETIGGRIKLKDAVAIVLSNLFAASITPAHAGGEITRIQLLRRYNLSTGDASAVVVGERMLDALFLGLAAPVGYLLFRQQIKSSTGFTTIFAIAAILFFIIFFVTLYVIAQPKKIKSAAIKLQWLFIRFRGNKKADETISKILREIDVFHNSSKRYLTDGRGALGKGFVYTVAFWIFQFSVASLILMGLGSQPWIVPSFSAQTVLMMIAMVPLTPGNSGIAEISTASIYSLFVSTAILGVFVLTWRIVTYYLNILVGGIISIKILKDTAVLEEAVNEVIDEIT
jgi:uncharacterized protein (TIRG00374 family)